MSRRASLVGAIAVAIAIVAPPGTFAGCGLDVEASGTAAATSALSFGSATLH